MARLQREEGPTLWRLAVTTCALYRLKRRDRLLASDRG
jgi:hypothetical protein